MGNAILARPSGMGNKWNLIQHPAVVTGIPAHKSMDVACLHEYKRNRDRDDRRPYGLSWCDRYELNHGSRNDNWGGPSQCSA